MNSCTNIKNNFPHKNWLSLLNVHEKQRKKTSRPTYSNLYAYAANNPVRYLDPDGRLPEDSVPLTQEQNKTVISAQDSALLAIDEFLNKLNSYDGNDLNFENYILNIIGYNIKNESERNQLKDSIKKISLSLYDMTQNDYRYDPKPQNHDSKAYVVTKGTRVLYGQSEFEKTIYITSNGLKNSLQKTLIHESAHKALNLTINKEIYGFKEILKIPVSQRRLNAESWAILILEEVK